AAYPLIRWSTFTICGSSPLKHALTHGICGRQHSGQILNLLEQRFYLALRRVVLRLLLRAPLSLCPLRSSLLTWSTHANHLTRRVSRLYALFAQLDFSPFIERLRHTK